MNNRLIISICILLFGMSAIAQKEYSPIYEDFGVWTEIGIEREITKKWKFESTFAYRWDENAQELSSRFIEFSINRDLKKKWDSGAKVRYSFLPDEQTFRFTPYVQKGFELGPIDLKYRLRADIEYEFNTFDQNPIESRLRNKFGIEYHKKGTDWDFGADVEWFHDADDNPFLASDIRYKVGAKYELNKRCDIATDFIIQQELNQVKPVREYIVSVGFYYEWKKKKSEDEIESLN